MKQDNKINYSEKLTYLENMSEHEFKTRSKEICKTIIIDQKMIEDGYINKRNEYEEMNKKMMEEINKDKPVTEKLSIKAFDTYIELVKQETRREYNKRLLRIIMG